MSAWGVHAVCGTCSWRAAAPSGSIHHCYFTVCPRCGAPKSQFNLEIGRYDEGEWEMLDLDEDEGKTGKRSCGCILSLISVVWVIVLAVAAYGAGHFFDWW